MLSATRRGCHNGRMITAMPIFMRTVRQPRSAASMNGLGELSRPLTPKWCSASQNESNPPWSQSTACSRA